MDRASDAPVVASAGTQAEPRTPASWLLSAGRFQTAAPLPVGSDPRSVPRTEPVHIAPLPSSPALGRYAKGLPAAVILLRRNRTDRPLNEGFLLRRLQIPPHPPAAAGNRSCCAQPRAACIAGLRTAPLPAQSSPASQQSGDGGLPGQKIALDLQLADLAVQLVNDLLRIPHRRRLVAARKQLARTRHQLLLPAADHRRMNPKLRRQLSQGFLPRKRRHRHSRLEFCAVLLPLDAHLSRPFGPVSL